MSPRQYQIQKPRLVFFYLFIGVILIFLFCGLAYRQLIKSDGYRKRELLQSHRRILKPGPRGNIFDREGRLLVGNRPRFAAVMYLSENRIRREFRKEYIVVRDNREQKTEKPGADLERDARANVIQRYLDQINSILGRNDKVKPEEINRHFIQKPLLPYFVINDLTVEEFAHLTEQIPVESPIQIYSTSTRDYPYGSALAHTLGYVITSKDIPEDNLPGDEFRTFNTKGSYGKDGLELQYDASLQGKTGSEIWVVDQRGFEADRVQNEPPKKGQDIMTSIDIDLQIAGEDAYGDRRGALVALDVESGEILAIVSKPDYDLNQLTPFISHKVFNQIEEDGAWINRATQGMYPPGSPFKLVTSLAGLRNGSITEETTSFCTGYFKLGRSNKPCWNHSGHGELDLREAIRLSCNVFYYEHSLKIGPDLISDEAKFFGLDQPTGIELPYEASRMIVPSPKWKKERQNISWVGGDTTNMSIGQGFLQMTPLQMACFTASLARGETRTTPTLIKAPPGQKSFFKDNQPIGLPAADIDLIYEGMERASQAGGTARLIQVPGVRIAAKTGTAQKRTPKGTLHLAWTIAFAPIEAPQIAIATVVVGEVDESTGGGTYAAPIAQKVFQRFFEKNPVSAFPSSDQP